MNKNLFKSPKIKRPVNVISETDAFNNAGGIAYNLEDKVALAKFVCTGTFNGTYYVSAEDQLSKVLELAKKVDTKFLAKLAVYSNQYALMKDSSAFLAAVIAARDIDTLSCIFTRVINDPKLFRNFIKVVRSGVTGRKSFGTRIKKLLQKYLENLTDEQLFKANVGNDPSLQDCLKMLHPKPQNCSRSALYGYLLGNEYNKNDLCFLANDFESFKKNLSVEMPDVPFQMLTALPLKDNHWKQIAKNATWNQTRMNLNTFERHNVFSDVNLTKLVADKLQNEEQIKRSKVFPYQLFTAYQNMSAKVPVKVTMALQKAADIALANVPEFNGKVYVMVDVSASMSSAVTGNRGSVITKARCIDVAALIASAILRKNPDAEIIPFDTKVYPHRLNPLDSVMTNTKMLAGFGGGGTDCHIALADVNKRNGKGDLVIYVSDNESFMDDQNYKQTATMKEWDIFKKRNPDAKLVNIDIQPTSTTQTHSRKDILNIGVFSDIVFDVIAKFIEFNNNKNIWIQTIEKICL